MINSRNTHYLHFTNYRDLVNWSVQYVEEHDLGFTKKYPMVRIGTFLSKSKDIISVQDNVDYKQVTLKINNGGIIPRNNGLTVKGSAIGTKRQTVIHAGQFIMSKIDARNGAYGIVPKDLDGAIVTNDFPVFNVDTSQIIPQFLVLISATDNFIEFARKCSSGTTNRKRIDVNTFLNQAIPLPSPKEQEIIVSNYMNSIYEASSLETKKVELETDKEKYLQRELTFSIKKVSDRNLLENVHFKDLSRWDVQFQSSKNEISSFYKTVKMSDIISDFMKDEDGKSLRIDTSKLPDNKYRYVGMESIEKNSGTLISLPEVSGKEIKSQTVIVPNGYFIFGKLRPYLNKYWRNRLEFTNIICSSEFFCFKIADAVNPDFFEAVLSSYIVQEQIADAMSGARMPRIDETIFKNISIPLPPPDIQDKIAHQMIQLATDSSKLSSTIDRKKETALREFRNLIFDNHETTSPSYKQLQES